MRVLKNMYNLYNLCCMTHRHQESAYVVDAQ